jgi:hypothetical protein
MLIVQFVHWSGIVPVEGLGEPTIAIAAVDESSCAYSKLLFASLANALNAFAVIALAFLQISNTTTLPPIL